jgi:hypothetical protein
MIPTGYLEGPVLGCLSVRVFAHRTNHRITTGRHCMAWATDSINQGHAYRLDVIHLQDL